MLDVGCGNGLLIKCLAPLYTNSTFTGIDITESWMKEAQNENASFSNANFEVINCLEIPDDWTAKFDLVIMTDVLHDLAFPEESLKQIWKILKPGGAFSCVEMNMDSDLKDQMKDPFKSMMMYSFSLYFCLTLSLKTEGSAGLGTCVGKQKLKSMIEEAGFSCMDILDIVDQPDNLHIIALK